MHPARSILLFSTLAGAGYGLLFVLALALLLGLLPPDPALGLLGMGSALALITAGLVCSLGHLRRPERAWRALSQWRSSWLSREGVAALLTYLPAGLLALFWVLDADTPWPLALLSAAGAAATVASTGMIYQSIIPVPRWHHPLTTPIYLCLALASGAVLAALLAGPWLLSSFPWLHVLALIALPLAWAEKWRWWQATDHAAPTATIGSATGLARFGKVGLLEPPHTSSNYLLNEMGYRVARKHAAKLRRIALVLGLAVPWLLVAVATLAPSPAFAILLTFLAAAATLAGTLVERWLFFAEAKHTMNLYYGEQAA
ncbi:dimethyl sulfoxide reductase anchor subunit family protein [Geminicoccus roseus]|uniref:dimethyl sulfoxide reductase anchor subunit family protein n=1 Tax=Geminicoccus roseus TaxID=404900 RepID=UPI00040835EA|nr:DmsC/YnfH family molybdoenzyme membrane anchor subunit [Geminicoccus roseus]